MKSSIGTWRNADFWNMNDERKSRYIRTMLKNETKCRDKTGAFHPNRAIIAPEDCNFIHEACDCGYIKTFHFDTVEERDGFMAVSGRKRLLAERS